MDCEEDQVHLYAEKLEQSVEKLETYEKLVNLIDKGELVQDLIEYCPELEKTSGEIEKLAYRKQILLKSIEEQKLLNSQIKSCCSTSKKKCSTKKMAATSDNQKERVVSAQNMTKTYKYVKVEDSKWSIKSTLEELIRKAVNEAYPQFEDIPVDVVETALEKFGDYQFSSSMLIAQKLKQLGIKMDYRLVAEEIVKKIPQHELIDKIEVAGNGYINMFLNIRIVGSKLGEIALKGLPKPKLAKRRVVVDFSSPNIAKEMHVGHLRSTIIGDGICRLFEYVDFEVIRINHIGDWGTQFGMLIAHLMDRFPNYSQEMPPISDLQAFYKESKKRFDEDEVFKRQAYECVVKLQNYDPIMVNAWKMICDISRKYFMQIYEKLDIRITERGESFYQDLMKELVFELDKTGAIVKEEGRKLMFVDGIDVPLTVVKSDGGFTYDTSDLAALKYRLEVDKGDWIIYVIDAGQSLHMESIFAAGRKLNWYVPEEKRIEHVGFGLVLGDDKKKFKTRSGDTIRLSDLLDEGIKRAEAKLREKEREKVLTREELSSVSTAVAYGCIKYSDLSQTRTKDYVFSFDKMLDDRGNTAVYLLYAYARIRSISRNAGVTDQMINNYINNLPANSIPLEHQAEIKLAKALLKFTDCILLTLDSLMLHQICDFVYRLATTFHDFYTECYIIHKNREGETVLNYHRLVLCRITADIMAVCFGILGIRTVEKM